MFMPEFFIRGDLVQTESDVSWRSGLLVDKWRLTGMNIRTENCTSTARRGMDCDSPRGTKNLGFQMAHETKSLGPKDLYVPIFASFPWFANVVEPQVPGVYDPMSKLKIHKCKSCPEERNFGTELWTEPETGTQVMGSQKLQVNIRLASDIANLSSIPGLTGGKIVDTAKYTIGKDIDILIPTFWVERYDAATPYQAAKLAMLQTLPRTINIIFGVLLVLGVIFIAGSYLLVRRGLGLRQKQAADLLTMRRGKDIEKQPSGSDTGRASTVEDIADTSNTSSGPQVLSPV
jgi:hypothetical protein